MEQLRELRAAHGPKQTFIDSLAQFLSTMINHFYRPQKPWTNSTTRQGVRTITHKLSRGSLTDSRSSAIILSGCPDSSSMDLYFKLCRSMMYWHFVVTARSPLLCHSRHVIWCVSSLHLRFPVREIHDLEPSREGFPNAHAEIHVHLYTTVYLSIYIYIC